MKKLVIGGLAAGQLYMISRCPAGLSMESILAASAWTRGVLPYSQFKMHCGPLVPALFAGLFVVPQMVWIGTVFCLFNFWAAWGVYKLASFYCSEGNALISAGLFLLALPFTNGNAWHVETMLTAFGVWALYFYESDSPLPMAVMLFLAMATKQTGLTYLLALVPFLKKRDFLSLGFVFLPLGLLLFSVAYHYGLIQPIIYQLGSWTLNHGINDPWAAGYRLRCALITALCLFSLVFFPKHYPVYWHGLVLMFGVQFMIVPQSHFILPMLPILCILAVMATDRVSKWVVLAVGIGGLVLCGHRFVNHVTRTKNVLDSYYIASVIKRSGMKLKPPYWTNYPQLYQVMGWPVLDNDFLAQIQASGKDLFKRDPYRKANTRVYLSFSKFDYETPSGGSWKDYPLDRSMYHWMRVWERN